MKPCGALLLLLLLLASVWLVTGAAQRTGDPNANVNIILLLRVKEITAFFMEAYYHYVKKSAVTTSFVTELSAPQSSRFTRPY